MVTERTGLVSIFRSEFGKEFQKQERASEGNILRGDLYRDPITQKHCWGLNFGIRVRLHQSSDGDLTTRNILAPPNPTAEILAAFIATPK